MARRDVETSRTDLGFLSAYPIWCTLIIAFDVIVIYALTVHWDEVRA